MKIKKLAMIATILVIGAMSIPTASAVMVESAEKIAVLTEIRLTFDEAMEDPGLVEAMYEQLDISLLASSVTKKNWYVASVEYDDAKYRIRGSYNEWMEFFYKRN